MKRVKKRKKNGPKVLVETFKLTSSITECPRCKTKEQLYTVTGKERRLGKWHTIAVFIGCADCLNLLGELL